MEIWIIEDYANMQKMVAVTHGEVAHVMAWDVADGDEPEHFTFHEFNDSWTCSKHDLFETEEGYGKCTKIFSA